MLICCDLLEETLFKFSIGNNFNGRFIDDMTIIPSETIPGLIYDGASLVFSEQQMIKMKIVQLTKEPLT